MKVSALLTLTITGLLFACTVGFTELAETTEASENGLYYVAVDGDDDNPGTLAEPWGTIQHAADLLAAGDAVQVRGGVYHEAVTVNVSGSESGGYITFQSYPGETAVLDGNGLSVPDDDTGLILIIDQHHLIIDGLEIRNYTTGTPHRVPVGINVRGIAHHIHLTNNHIHHVETNAPVDGDLLGADAHGIAIFGTESPQSLHNILIDGNNLHDLKLGSSEAMVFNGNVETFTVTNNLIYDSDNIALDFIGFEGTAPDEAYDQARDGMVSDNIIHHIDTIDNPAYGGERSAGGIYVDGGQNIIIERNQVYEANIGIEIASEHAGRATSQIMVRNNFVYHNHIAGIAMGGYDEERGSTEDSFIINNTLYHNDSQQDGNGELMIQYDTRNNVIKNNVFCANDQNLLISNAYTANSGNAVDNNLYFAMAGADDSEWQWQDVYYQGFDEYQASTGNDANSLFVDPLLVDETAPDLHLQSTSPAINVGEGLLETGELDIDGEERVNDGRIDMGADEYWETAVMTEFIYLALVVTSEPSQAGYVANNSDKIQPGRIKPSGRFWFTRLSQTARQ